VNPFVSCYTAVSRELADWLVEQVGIAPSKVIRICNGVNAARFIPRSSERPPIGPEGFVQSDSFIVGTVGRMQTVKDQLTLVRAFLDIIQSDPDARSKMRLVMIGDGPLRTEAQEILAAASATSLAWLPGERSDIPELMRSLDLFVLPSIAEGISNTILEAMACGLPVVATRVGGNSELVQNGVTGLLVPPSNPNAMAEAIYSYFLQPGKVVDHGNAARDRVEKEFSLDRMIDRYLAVYDSVLIRPH
jgi:sugar transferase (PEP-CTERM/EpsH1 system associated)